MTRHWADVKKKYSYGMRLPYYSGQNLRKIWERGQRKQEGESTERGQRKQEGESTEEEVDMEEEDDKEEEDEEKKEQENSLARYRRSQSDVHALTLSGISLSARAQTDELQRLKDLRGGFANGAIEEDLAFEKNYGDQSDSDEDSDDENNYVTKEPELDEPELDPNSNTNRKYESSVRYKDGETYRDVVKLSSWHDVQRLDTYKKTAEFIYNFFEWKKDDRKESEEERRGR